MKKTKTSKENKKNSRNPAKIKVVGVGGGGGNAITRMREDFIKGVEFIAINCDVQDLDYCNVHKKIYIGKNVTRGLGAGMNPDLGRQAAEENRAEIAEALRGADLVFITCGLGGGSGSGGVSVVAEVAREVGALTIAVVTKPFAFEGKQRMDVAIGALTKLKEKVDAYIVVPNDRIFSIINKETSILKAFEAIDDVLRNSVKGIAELITLPGMVNIDFADVKAVMQNTGAATIGIGMASGKDRAITAVNQAISPPLLESGIEGAKGILYSISGGRDLKMNEINDIGKIIADSIDQSAKIIFGTYHDRKLKQGQIKVTVIATSFNGTASLIKKPELTSVTNLFGERISMESRHEEPRSVPKLEPRPLLSPALSKVTGPTVSTSESSKPNEDTKKKAVDIWDIPAFLRKKKK